MKVKPASIADVLIIEPDVFRDSRGCFFESYSLDKYASAGIPSLVQFNQSYSVKGVIRGLHLQLNPHAQGKLVYVVDGLVQDVAVDLREKSKTFLNYVSVELSGEKKNQLWIPPGFAHGFLVLSDSAIFCYGVSKPYNKESERGIIWNDESIGIDWKDTSNVILSDKDKALPSLNDYLGQNSSGAKCTKTIYHGNGPEKECKVIGMNEFEEKSKENNRQKIINLTLRDIKNFE